MTEADRELDTGVVVDLSASLDFGTAGSKTRPWRWPATAAWPHLTRAAATIGSLVATAYHTPPYIPSGALMHGPVLHLGRVAQTRVPRSVLGDLAEAIEQLRRPPRLRCRLGCLRLPGRIWLGTPCLRALSARHYCSPSRCVDAPLLELPEVGTVVLSDPETVRRAMWTPPRCSALFAAAPPTPRSGGRDLRRCGAAHLVLRTDRDGSPTCPLRGGPNAVVDAPGTLRFTRPPAAM